MWEVQINVGGADKCVKCGSMWEMQINVGGSVVVDGDNGWKMWQQWTGDGNGVALGCFVSFKGAVS